MPSMSKFWSRRLGIALAAVAAVLAMINVLYPESNLQLWRDMFSQLAALILVVVEIDS